MSRTEYEFEGVGGRYLVKAPGIVFEDRAIGLIVNESNPLASELLKLARIVDAYDDLAREFIGKVDRSDRVFLGEYANKLEALLLAREGL